MLFQDREDAGRQLAERLIPYQNEKPLILAIPRGGVPVGYEIARVLQAPLDVIVVRKLGAPGNPEFGIGAIGPGGVRILDQETIRGLRISPAELDRTIEAQQAEMERRIQRFRGDRPLPEVSGRTIILVDDGLATGVTARAAVQALRRQHPKRLILAVPVAAPETAEALRAEVDELVCLATPVNLWAIGLWYRNFEQVSDEEVLAWLERARQRKEEPAAGVGTA